MQPTLSWLDYLFFVLMLVVSALIGVYYGFVKQQKTASDYLLGGKRMGIWPIAMSLISSSLSGFTLLSVPADIYRYGVMICFSIPMIIVTFIIGYYTYIPVFYNLQVTSIYEYLKIRFNHKVRIFASMLFTIHMLLTLPITIYVPAMALGQVINMDTHYMTPIVCTVCIFYTALGGIKAVVWTDAVQFIVMAGSLLAVVTIGILNVGGFGYIFEKAVKGNRLDVNFDVSLVKRDTFWAWTLIHIFVLLNYFVCNQSFIQKCLALPSFQSVKTALILSGIGIVTLMAISYFSGFILFAKYSECDPLKRNIINTYEKLLPMFVVEELNFVPGLVGLFISGLFSAALSTLSAAMNCLAATIYEDFISPFVSKKTSQGRISVYLKLLVVIIGIICTSGVYVIEKLGSLVALAASFAGVTAGPLLGLFSVGMFLPSVKSNGALCGAVTSFLVMSWIIMTSQWLKLQKLIIYPVLHVSTDRCNATVTSVFNKTLSMVFPSPTNITAPEPPFILYRISFLWYPFIGVLIVAIISPIVSYFWRDNEPLNRDCISPIAQFLIKKKADVSPQYHSLDRALVALNKT